MPHKDKEVLKKYREEYRRKNAVMISERAKKWRKAHIEHLKESKAAYYAEHKEIIKKRSSDYSRNNRDKVSAMKRRYAYRDIKSRLRQGLKRLIETDKKRGRAIDTNVTLEYLLSIYDIQNGVCAATGLPLLPDRHHLCAASIDRIDNAKGHIVGNIQLVCKWANIGRGQHTVVEFASVLEQFVALANTRCLKSTT